jgi:ISXO2-like transposase domain
MPPSDLPSLRAIWHIVDNEPSAIGYLLSKGIFYFPKSCSLCDGPISFIGKNIRCTKDGCRKSVSLFAHSFFAGSKIPIHNILLLGYIWLTGATYTVGLTQSGLTTHAVVDYYAYFRQLVSSSLEPDDSFIGGPGVVVEVDESKFGKRKYNRGKHVEGAWVIGGIERTLEGKFFAEVVERRDSETIVDVLSRHLLPGTILHSDCWKGYIGIDLELDIIHKTVNHSIEFVDSESGVHTNTIEGKWAALKRRITLRGRVKDSLDNYLLAEIWRSKNKSVLWSAFIHALKDVHCD